MRTTLNLVFLPATEPRDETRGTLPQRIEGLPGSVGRCCQHISVHAKGVGQPTRIEHFTIECALLPLIEDEPLAERMLLQSCYNAAGLGGAAHAPAPMLIVAA